MHAHGLRAGALTALAVAVIRPTAYDTRPALIVTVHNAPPDRGVNGAIYRVLEKIVARSADSVLCVSADLEQRMQAAGARRIGRAVVPAALLPAAAEVSAQTRPAIRAEFGASPGQAIVLGAGRWPRRRGSACCWTPRPGGPTSGPSRCSSSPATGRLRPGCGAGRRRSSCRCGSPATAATSRRC